MTERYFLDQDQSFHWYIIPASKRAEWEEWNNIPDDDERAWTAPDFAQIIGGNQNMVTFESPKIES